MSKIISKKVASTSVSPIPFPVVGIGASAGGVAAVTEMLKNLKPDTGMAFVIILHLDPKHKSMLPEIFQKATKMKVNEVSDNKKLEKNQLYVIIPGKHIIIKGDHLELIDRLQKPAPNLPIDLFFHSLAEGQKEAAIGIILSGSASDGTLGLKAIKKAGGLTYAQDDTAEFKSMPTSAVAEKAVDVVLPPAEIAMELNRLGKKKHLLIPVNKELPKETENLEEQEEEILPEEDLTKILRFLHKNAGVDFSSYKENTIRRRITRRMLLNKMDTLDQYLGMLKENPDEINIIYDDLLINVTNFFRDLESTNYLKKTIIPELIQSKTAREQLRIWVPACSSGEEAYTLAIIISEVLSDNNIKIPVQIFATDLSKPAIAKARSGIYTPGDLSHVPKPLLEKFFTRIDGHYRINKNIREMCVFAVHNIIKDPPFSKVDLISCCNLLIYLEAVLQKKILANFHYALNDNGYLVLGKSESIGTSTQYYSLVHKKLKIFKRKSGVQAKVDFFPAATVFADDIEKSKKTPVDQHPENIEPKVSFNLEKTVDNILLTQYSPAGVVVNSDLDILHFRGSISPYLEPSPGKASLNLLKMARPGLALELRNAVNKVLKTGNSEKKSGLELSFKGNKYRASFEIMPLHLNSKEKLLLIIFEESKAEHPATAKGNKKPDNARAKQLEAELNLLREDIRSIIEKQEEANEELQSANEEIVSSNEELQSINEELETSKEELESTNEELLTINNELQIRNDQLSEAYEYTEAVIATIREAVLVLEKNLIVKSANKAFYDLFKVDKQETEGRIIYEIGNGKGDWDIPDLKKIFRELLHETNSISGYEISHNFKDIGEKILVLNAKKIIQRIHDQEIILVSIEDITEHRHTQRMLLEREEWLRKMVDSVPVIIWVAGPDKKFTYLNKTWQAFTGQDLKKEKITGWEKSIHKDDLVKFLETYNSSFDKKKPFTIEYRMLRQDNEFRWVLNSANPTYDSENKFTGFTGSCTEIHDDKLMSEALERTNEELQQFAYIASHDLQEPLRKMMIFSQKVIDEKTENLTEKQNLHLEKIVSSAGRMRQLIDDLLNYSKISNSVKAFKQTDLNELVKTVVEDFDILIEEKNASVTINKLPTLKAIPLLINQMFNNLISNALKFKRKDIKPKIDITSRKLTAKEVKEYPLFNPKEKYFEIIVKDNGIGFSQEYAEQIFLIFQRLNGKVEFTGTGIGLALCKKIAIRHGGDIFAVSKEGKGSEFHVILPEKPVSCEL